MPLPAASTDARPPFWGWAWGSVLTACACFGAGWLGQQLPGAGGLPSLFWPAGGVALAVLVRFGPHFAPAVLLAAGAVHSLAGLPPWLAGAVALGNTAGPLLAAVWLRRAKFNLRLEQRRDLLLLIGAGALGASVVSAANGAAWLAIGGRISTLHLPSAALARWAGDTLGLFVAGIPLLTLSRSGLRQALGPGLRARSLLLLAGSVLTVLVALSLPRAMALPALALLTVPVLLLVWLAMRAGVGPASGAVLALGGLLIGATAGGAGPFVTQPPGDGSAAV